MNPKPRKSHIGHRIPSRTSRHGATRRDGVTAVEVILSTMLVGIVLVGALECLAANVRGQVRTDDFARAELLAVQLMTEVTGADYADPDEVVQFGPETTEPASNAGPRSSYDDVDDFHSWSKTPIQDPSGADMSGYDGWQRDVIVEWVEPNDPSTVSGTDQGVKRITIEVRFEGVLKAKLIALRTNSY